VEKGKTKVEAREEEKKWIVTNKVLCQGDTTFGKTTPSIIDLIVTLTIKETA
jgi:hypothetical protein